MPTHCCSIFQTGVYFGSVFRYRRFLFFLSSWAVLFAVTGQLVEADEPTVAADSEWKVRVSAGGIGRYVAGRWGMTKAVAFNTGKSTKTGLVVITPPGSKGLQYAKTITVPARASLETTWPVRVGQVETRISDFPYLVFPGGVEDGVIHKTAQDEFIPNYSGMIDLHPMVGQTGVLANRNESAEQLNRTLKLLRVFLYSRTQDPKTVTINAEDLSQQSECLEPLDQLTVTSSALLNFPHAIASIREWVQRGGNLWIRLDRTGLDPVRAILSEALPLSLVGETSTNNVTLTLNPAYRQSLFPTRKVERTFDEPIRYVRLIQSGGDVMWSIDEWPVAIRVPVGRGSAMVTTVDSSVFFERRERENPMTPEYRLIPSAEVMQQSMYGTRQESTLPQAVVSEQAASIIGYNIPSQATAILLTLCFPVLLLAVGIWLQRNEKGERLIFLLPALAGLVALPAIGIGSLGRRVAPTTVIETGLVRSVPGWNRQVSDGFASVFDVGTNALNVTGADGAILEIGNDSTNRSYRQLVWNGSGSSRWKNLDQPDGIQTLSERSTEPLDRPVSVTASFDENGVVGKLDSGGLKDAGDVIVAGFGSERMSVTLESDGSFHGTPEDVLSKGNYLNSRLVTDQQHRRAEIYGSILEPAERERAFPETASLMFWAESNHVSLNIGDANARRQRSLLCVHPLRILSPDVGAKFTIPSAFISYRTTSNAEGGGFSGVYDNSKREWTKKEEASTSFLLCQIPDACLPFDTETAKLDLTIRAGSRTLSLSAGGFDAQTLISTLVSPLGKQTITIPPDLIRESLRDGKFYLTLSVSDLENSEQDEEASETQDDYWEISQLQFTLTGKRTTESP